MNVVKIRRIVPLKDTSRGKTIKQEKKERRV